uniref:Uncharacterized protein n=1 Tax=Rhizophora mucronata TaxID=61149 RepID=A0A2P2NAD4_RHIMU
MVLFTEFCRRSL